MSDIINMQSGRGLQNQFSCCLPNLKDTASEPHNFLVLVLQCVAFYSISVRTFECVFSGDFCERSNVIRIASVEKRKFFYDFIFFR